MESKEFKKIFNEVATNYGFEAAFGGWFKESDECIAAMYLQKSNYGNYYELNIKIFIQGIFGNQYKKTKDLKYSKSAILARQPKEFQEAFDLDSSIESAARRTILQHLFATFINDFTKKALTRVGIEELIEGGLFILPTIKAELEKLEKNNGF
jgi:hypothetical protein